MNLRELYKSLSLYQSWYNWLYSLQELEKIDLEDSEWRFLFILETLKMWKSLWFKIFKESDKEVSLKEIRKLFTWCKSYKLNITIAWWKLKTIIESLAYEFKDNEVNYELIPWLITKTLSINNFLRWISLKEVDDKDIKKDKIVASDFLFIWKSWKIYSWTWMVQVRAFNEEKLLDIIEWYKWENETFKKIVPYLLNNREELKEEFKQYRFALLSSLAILLWLESKAVDYILAKLENKVTEETIIDSNKAPF